MEELTFSFFFFFFLIDFGSLTYLVLDSRICTRVFTILRVNFPMLAAAEEHYNLTLSNCLEEMEAVKSPRRVVDKVTQTPALPNTAVSISGTNPAKTTSSYDISKILSLY